MTWMSLLAYEPTTLSELAPPPPRAITWILEVGRTLLTALAMAAAIALGGVAGTVPGVAKAAIRTAAPVTVPPSAYAAVRAVLPVPPILLMATAAEIWAVPAPAPVSARLQSRASSVAVMAAVPPLDARVPPLPTWA